jgi:small subunit ribosomal protein S11
MATSISVKKAIDIGLRQVEVNVCGPGSGRETAIRTIQSLGLSILLIKDVTPIPHNGCRPQKRRRI